MSRTAVLKEQVLNCYREMFAASTPSADFDELMANATINEHGQKEIPYMDYEISSEEFDKILDMFLNDKKIKMTTLEKKVFSQTIHLGCSPKTKREH